LACRDPSLFQPNKRIDKEKAGDSGNSAGSKQSLTAALLTNAQMGISKDQDEYGECDHTIRLLIAEPTTNTGVAKGQYCNADDWIPRFNRAVWHCKIEHCNSAQQQKEWRLFE
jgi:hypothetical protein